MYEIKNIGINRNTGKKIYLINEQTHNINEDKTQTQENDKIINYNSVCKTDINNLIQKDKDNTNIFLIELFKSKILKNLNTRITKNFKKIFFECIEVISLTTFLERNKNKLSYNDTLELATCLFKQIENLEKNKYTFMQINIENIYVIINISLYDFNKNVIFICLDTIFPIQKDNTILIDRPFPTTNPYIDTELLKIKELPSNIYFKSVFFNLGLIMLKCLNMNVIDINKLINTKLYYHIKRCLDKSHKNIYLYI